jgi:hypothetical protein
VSGRGVEGPWYLHSWPWFIVILLGVSVIGSLVTVGIALNGRDPEVSGDRVEDAKSVRRSNELEARAAALGIGAEISLHEGGELVVVDLWGDNDISVPQMDLSFTHPTLEDRDRNVHLRRDVDGRYRGSMERPIAGRYDLLLEPIDGPGRTSAWKLVGRRTIGVASPAMVGTSRGAAR